MLTRAELKTNAKHALEGKWGKGALITLCYVVFFFVIGLVAGLLSFVPFLGMLVRIANAVIQVPIALGLVFAFIKLKRGEEVGAFEFLELGFSNFKKAWAIVGRTLLKMIAPIIVMVVILIAMMFFGVLSVGSIAGGSVLRSTDYSSNSFDLNDFMDGYSYDYDYDFDFDFDDVSYNPYARSSSNPYARSTGSSLSDGSSSADIGAGLVGVGIGSAIVLIVLSLAYFGVSIWATCKGLYYTLAQFIAFDNPNMTGKEIVQRSEDLMRGNRGKLFILQLSFIGWAILAAIPLGIGSFWLIPYMMVTLVCFYEELAGGNNNTNVVQNNNMNQYNNQAPNMNQYNNQIPQAPEMNQYNNQAPQAPNMNQYNNQTPQTPEMNQDNNQFDNNQNNQF